LHLPQLLYVVGPFLAAVTVTGGIEGRAGLRTLLGRLIRWRVGGLWYVVALGLAPALIFAAVLLNVLLGAPAPAATQLGVLPGVLLAFPVVLLKDGAWEELGWRGFALPRLQARRSPLAASLILGVLWAGWHLPIMITNVVERGAPWGGNVAWALWLIPGAILFTWLFNNSRGNVLVVVLAHAAENALGGAFAFNLYSGADQLRQLWLVAAVSLIAVLILVALTGQDLSHLRSARGQARSKSVAIA
jgi:membrane protease YdiL (CAAX protease family)